MQEGGCSSLWIGVVVGEAAGPAGAGGALFSCVCAACCDRRGISTLQGWAVSSSSSEGRTTVRVLLRQAAANDNGIRAAPGRRRGAAASGVGCFHTQTLRARGARGARGTP